MQSPTWNGRPWTSGVEISINKLAHTFSYLRLLLQYFYVISKYNVRSFSLADNKKGVALLPPFTNKDYLLFESPFIHTMDIKKQPENNNTTSKYKIKLRNSREKYLSITIEQAITTPKNGLYVIIKLVIRFFLFFS